MIDNNTELEVQFAAIVAEKNLTNLGQYKRWAAKNAELAAKFAEVSEILFEEVDIFEEGSKRGRSFNFLPFDDFKAMLKDNNIKSSAQYHDFRDKQPKAIQKRLPFTPKDVYTTVKAR